MGQNGSQLIRIHTVSNIASMNAISTPMEGNLVYVQTVDAIYYYDGTNWLALSSSSSASTISWKLAGNQASSTDVIGTTNNSDLNIRTNNIQRMTVKNDGKVGIDITNPSGAFQIGETQGGGYVFLTASTTSAENEIIDNDLSTTGWINIGNEVLYNGSSQILIGAYNLIKSTQTTLSSPSSLVFQARSNDNSPWVTLDTQTSINWSATTMFQVMFTTITQTYEDYRIVFNSDGYLVEARMFERQPPTEETKFIVLENGNVGVGTDNPTQKLHVSGNILASGTIAPDYVFESYFEGESQLNPEYQFTELEKTIEFAKKHHHLPNIPSSKEVKEQGGIVLNKAVEQNLEKIEELYIHTSNLNKELTEMRKTILEYLE
ncbi:MAG: hypothetical protein ISR00_04165 [Flavobacteriales bacterium]|nr:hypothetical protein [Flavobacteriales bacterium]